MGWEMVKLGEFIEETRITNKEDEALPVYSVTKHHGFMPSKEFFNKTVHSKDLTRYKICNTNDWAYSTIHLDEGSLGFAPERCLISPMYKTFTVDETALNREFLYCFLKSRNALKQYSLIGQGSVERRRSVKFDEFERVKIPLPPLEEQQRIAKILNSVEDQVTNVHRQKSLASTLQVSFFEACTNSNSTLKSLGDSGLQVITGKSLTAKGNDASPDSFVIKVSAVSSGIFDASEIKPLPASYTPNPDHLIHEGDLLFARASGSPSLLGAVAIAPATKRNLYLPDKVWKISCPNIPNAVLHTALQTQRFRRHVESNASGASGVMNVRRTTLSEFEIPQLNEIEAFELNSQLLQIDNLASSLTKKAMLLNELYTSLSSRAFAGEL